MKLRITYESPATPWRTALQSLGPSGDVEPAGDGTVGPPPEGKPEPREKPKVASLGGGGSMVLSTLVNIDGEWRNITQGYPKVSKDGNKLTVTVRFPPFDKYAMYDPLMWYGDGDDDNGAETAATTALPFATILLATAGTLYAGAPLHLDQE